MGFAGRPRGLNKSVIRRVIIMLTPFRVLITLLITHLLSSLGLQVGFRVQGSGFRVVGFGVSDSARMDSSIDEFRVLGCRLFGFRVSPRPKLNLFWTEG